MPAPPFLEALSVSASSDAVDQSAGSEASIAVPLASLALEGASQVSNS